MSYANYAGPLMALAQIITAVNKRNQNRYIAQQMQAINDAADSATHGWSPSATQANDPGETRQQAVNKSLAQSAMLKATTPMDNNGYFKQASGDISNSMAPLQGQMLYGDSALHPQLKGLNYNSTADTTGGNLSAGDSGATPQPLVNSNAANAAPSVDAGTPTYNANDIQMGSSSPQQSSGIMAAAQAAAQNSPTNANTNTNTNTIDTSNAYHAIQRDPNATVPTYGDSNDYMAAEKAHPEWYVGNTYVGDDADARAAAEDKFNNMTPGTAQYNSEYQANMREHPDQFVGSTYVGDDDKARQQAVAQQQAAAAQKQAQYVHDHTPQFQSYQAVKDEIQKRRAAFQAEILKRYGPDVLKQTMPVIDDTINDKMKSYATKLDDINRQELYGTLGSIDLSNGNNYTKVLLCMENYNHKAQEMGLPTIDTTYVGKILQSGEAKQAVVDTGGALKIISQRPDGRSYGTDANGNPITCRVDMVLDKSASPDKVLASKTELTKQQMHEDGEDRRTAANNSTKLQAAQISASARSSGGGGGGRGGSGGSGGSGKPSKTYNKLMDTLAYNKEAAIEAIRNGSASDDPDNHDVEDYRKACVTALESGELDDDDKAAVQKDMDDTMNLYQNSL